MKNLNYLIVAAMTIASGATFAQADNDDESFATHTLDVNVPEVALIDIFDANTGQEAGAILFDMALVGVAGTNKEAGIYAFEDMSYSNLFLNYTSVTGAASSGFDASRRIDVQFELGSTFPDNLDLRITPQAPVVIANGGTAGSAGSITAGGVALGTTVPVGTDALLVNSIESVYTGDEQYGVKLTYTLEQNGNFASYQAGTYQSTLRYTISDF